MTIAIAATEALSAEQVAIPISDPAIQFLLMGVAVMPVLGSTYAMVHLVVIVVRCLGTGALILLYPRVADFTDVFIVVVSRPFVEPDVKVHMGLVIPRLLMVLVEVPVRAITSAQDRPLAIVVLSLVIGQFWYDYGYFGTF